MNQSEAEFLPAHMLRTVDGYRFVDHTTRLGRREAVSGIEYSPAGMKTGGYRKVRVSPHLAYHGDGLTGLIPPGAVLIVELWLRQITTA